MAKQKPHRGRGGSRHIGRLRIRAAELLTKGLGFNITPEAIVPVTGAWRTNVMLDVYRWEVFTQNSAGVPVIFGCWDTLTKFVKEASRAGFHVTPDREIYFGATPKVDRGAGDE